MALPLSYNVRNVRKRWQVTLLAISGIALVVAVFTVLMSMSEGFAIALRATGREGNAMVVQRGSASELTSWVPLDQQNLIVVGDEVARGADGQPLASPGDGHRHHQAQEERRAHQRHGARRRPAGLRGARGNQGRPGPQLHARPRRGDRGREDRGPRAGPGRRPEGEAPEARVGGRRHLHFARRRLRERDLGRRRGDGPRVRAQRRHQRPGRASEGRRGRGRPWTAGSRATRRCSSRRCRSGSTTTTRRGRWPGSCAVWPPSWPSSWGSAPSSGP